MDEVTAVRPHKSIKFTINLWTAGLASDETKVRRGHAWYQGVIHVQANPVHEITSQGDPIPFHSPDELREAFEKAAAEAGVYLHEPGSGELLVSPVGG
jgi:hypothetical protein